MTARITTLSAPPDLDRLCRIMHGVREAWPEPARRPEFIHAAFDAEASPEPGSVVVALIDAEDRNFRYKLIDRLRSAGCCGVLLASAPDQTVPDSADGVLLVPAGIEPRCLAWTLMGMTARQRTIDELARELRIAQKTSGGVREEMSRISQELSLAAKIQQELVPRAMPEVAGLDFGVIFRPAGYVSGDIYNIAQIDDRTVAFFIADAVGHGVPAALLTMIISRSLPMRGGISQGRIITPADALGSLNDELCDVSDGNPRFATAVYGLIDTRSGIVRIANGGHPQPLRIGREGVAHVEAGGPLLGVFHDAAFQEETFELRPGETLLLYSDGFETAFPNVDEILRLNTPAPSKRYLDHLLSIGRHRTKEHLPIAEALQTLSQELDTARGSLHQADDVTALALARR
jgi:serine phosphatase RsbU (regulator of sigma subunit)